jgi:hypothetical protein
MTANTVKACPTIIVIPFLASRLAAIAHSLLDARGPSG